MLAEQIDRQRKKKMEAHCSNHKALIWEMIKHTIALLNKSLGI